MKEKSPQRIREIGKTLVVYLGSAWVFIEVFNFLVDKYFLDNAFLDIVILLVIFGLPAAIIHAWFGQKFTKKAIFLYTLNGVAALLVIGYNFINPDALNPTELRLLRFQGQKKKLAQSIRSIAILPFSNLTGDDDNSYLVSGMQDALIGELGKVGSIRVISRTSTLPYENVEKSIQAIAGELGVDGIIESTVLTAANTIRIQVILINAFPEEQQLWSKTFEFAKDNILKLYTDISKSLAKEINATISPQTQEIFNRKRQANPDAYEAYLRGKTYLSTVTEKGFRTAEDYFLKAVEIDPEFVSAYGGLAGVWVSLRQLNLVSPDEATPKIREFINKAFALDSSDAEVWRWQASELGNGMYDWKGCNKAMDRCLEINPNFAEARAFYAHFLMIQSKWQEAWEQMDTAIQIDPYNPLIQGFREIMLLHSKRYSEMNINAVIILEGVILNGILNRPEAAIDAVKKWMPEIGKEKLIPRIEESYKEKGLKDVYNLIIDSVLVDSTIVLPLQATVIFNLIAENKEKALFWLEQMYIKKDPNLPYWFIQGSPLSGILRNEPRYIEIMKRINLSD